MPALASSAGGSDGTEEMARQAVVDYDNLQHALAVDELSADLEDLIDPDDLIPGKHRPTALPPLTLSPSTQKLPPADPRSEVQKPRVEVVLYTSALGNRNLGMGPIPRTDHSYGAEPHPHKTSFVHLFHRLLLYRLHVL